MTPLFAGFSGTGCRISSNVRSAGVDGVLDRLEDMRRRELIHRDRQRVVGVAEERLEFAPAGLRTDADGQLHLIVHRQRGGAVVRLLVGAGLGRREIQRLLAAEQRLERRCHRAGGRSERDRWLFV